MLDWPGARHALLPGSQVPGYTTGATELLGSDQSIARETQFSIPLDFSASEESISHLLSPACRDLKSNWPDPAFRGAFSPAERSVLTDRCEMEGVLLRP